MPPPGDRQIGLKFWGVLIGLIGQQNGTACFDVDTLVQLDPTIQIPCSAQIGGQAIDVNLRGATTRAAAPDFDHAHQQITAVPAARF